MNLDDIESKARAATGYTVCLSVDVALEMVAEIRRLRAALQEIAAGKTPADSMHPLDAEWAMAARFLTIAQDALRIEPAQGEGRKDRDNG
jgi:hypothetical protein